MCKSYKSTLAAAFALTIGLTGLTASAQSTSEGKEQFGQSAPVPQYWIADASLFIVNAANTAAVLYKEQGLSVQEPMILGNQAEFLVEATDRALSSLEELLSNAEATNPDAVPSIRIAMAELTAAKAQAQAVADAANNGELGPTYVVTVRSALDHLKAAEDAMGDIAKDYRAGDLAISSGRGFKDVGRTRIRR